MSSSWFGVALLGVICLILPWFSLKEWQENSLYVDAILGVILGIITTAIASTFINNVGWLVEWTLLCVIIILTPVLLCMPFISQKRAERIAREYAEKKKPNATISIRTERTKLDCWKWHVTGDFQGIEPHALSGPFTAVVSAKWGTIKSSKNL